MGFSDPSATHVNTVGRLGGMTWRGTGARRKVQKKTQTDAETETDRDRDRDRESETETETETESQRQKGGREVTHSILRIYQEKDYIILMLKKLIEEKKEKEK